MKSLPLHLSAFALAFVFSSSLLAQKEEKPIEGQIGVFIEYIQLDEPTATKLIRAHTGEGTKLRNELQTLVDTEKAAIIESSYLLVSSGSKGRIESVAEFIYPTEYDPPETPIQVTGNIGDGVVLAIPASPTAFNVRNLGNILEATAAIESDLETVSLSISPEIVEHTGKTVYGNGLSEATQPTFFTLHAQSFLRIKSNEYALLSVQTPRDPKAKEREPNRDTSKRVFIMVRPTILEPTASKK